MKTLVTLWPWWSHALLFLNIAAAAVVLGLRYRRKSFERLTVFRIYLLYSALAGVVAFVAACLTPVGASYYGKIAAFLDAGFNVLLVLLCAQVVDQGITRREVRLVKTLWLLLLPTILGIVVIALSLYPHLNVKRSLYFDLACALSAAGVLVFATIKPSDLRPDEPWVRDYRPVILGLAVQIGGMCLAKPVEALWSFPVTDIFTASASLVTMAVFAVAIVRSSPVSQSVAVQTAL